MDLTIKKIGINGEGIGYDNKVPVFVMGALQNEVVECKVVQTFPRYKVAELVQIKQKSKDRVMSACRAQKDCGGCPLMILDYQKQLQVKQELLAEALKKYADGYIDLIEEVVPSPQSLRYRNQCKLPIKWIKDKLCSGLYQSGTNHLVGWDACPAHEAELDEARLAITRILNESRYHDYDERNRKGIRSLVVRRLQGKLQATIVTGNDLINKEVIDKIMALPNMTSLFQNVNVSRKQVPMFGEKWENLGGNRSLMIEENGLKLKLSAASFFQLNTQQAFALYQKVHELVPECNLLVEAYCGIGTMSLILSDKADEIVGIEVISSAVKNANENAKLNRIENATFQCGDAAELLEKISKKRKIDVLLIDPPRSGIDDAMLDCIMKSKIKTILYVSCNPATLAKNLKELSYRYEVERIVPYDMFPNTPLVETIVVLKRN